MEGIPLYLHHRYSHFVQPPDNQYPFAGLELIPAGSFNNSAAVETAIRKDLGIGLISRLALPGNSDLIPFDVEGMQFTRTINLIRDTSPFPPQEVMDFVEFIFDYLRRHISENDLYL